MAGLQKIFTKSLPLKKTVIWKILENKSFPIETVQQNKFLGLIVDSKLSWKTLDT